MRILTPGHIWDCLKHYYHLGVAGIDNTFSHLWQSRIEAATKEWDKGPMVILWRKLRDGTETREEMPLYWAEMTIASIPECEPLVERAKIVR
jgi:hypothetical protein